ncbi:hypothetical protein [Sphingobium phenoxybenzoativorans]|uniref:hypothetical protein n=1 Tax=Sphingobium phenoxybenzoativorans TaxID=1592790 RepID=UPI001112DEBA|nr:hypothetical protein [Sphingobium phenoxybenzoativorans]
MGKNLRVACAILMAAASCAANAQTVNISTNGRVAPANPITFNGGVGVKIKGTVQNAVIGPAIFLNAAMTVWSDPAAVVSNMTMKGVFISDTWREGIRITGNADGVQIQDFNIAMRNIPQTNDQIPTGIVMFGGKNILIQRGSVSGFKTIPIPNTYANGDGVAAEKAVDRLTIEDVDSSDNSDGGFDLKSTNTVLRNLSASRNYRSYRFWGTAAATTLTSTDPVNAHVWAGGGAVVVIDKLIATSKTNALILYVDGAKSVTIKSCELSVPPGTKLMYKATAATVVTLGAGCKLP